MRILGLTLKPRLILADRLQVLVRQRADRYLLEWLARLRFISCKYLSARWLLWQALPPRPSVNAIEKGKFDPSLPLAFKAARLFGISIEEIFQDEVAN